MGMNSKINWCDHTWNPWQGCHKVSQGCKYCYMHRDLKRYGRNPNTVIRSANQTFNMPFKIKEPATVFTCSWSDFFIEEADQWRTEAWEIIRKQKHLVFLILTKRPERIMDCLPRGWNGGWPNVCLMVSTENQESADERIPLLLSVPALYRGISAEPLLGLINFGDYISRNGKAFNKAGYTDSINWIIVGGESGPSARPMHPDWARRIRNDCRAAGTPFFFKQNGEFLTIPDAGNLGLKYSIADVLNANTVGGGFIRVGRNNSGRLLDGREWNETPWNKEAR